MVIEGKDQVGHKYILVFPVTLSLYLFTFISELVANMFLEHALNLYGHVSLQAQGWRVAQLELTARLFVDIFVPVFVRALRDIEFN